MNQATIWCNHYALPSDGYVRGSMIKDNYTRSMHFAMSITWFRSLHLLMDENNVSVFIYGQVWVARWSQT